MSAAGGSSRLHSLHFIPQLFPFFRSLQLQRRQLLSRGSKCAPAPFRPHRQETKARDSPRTPELDAVGEAPALPSAGPQLEQRLRLPRATWPPGSPVPQAYSSRHALGRSFLLCDPAGTPSPGPAPPPRRPHGSVRGAALALAQAPEPRWSREEEEERGPERQREVGQGGGVAGEGWETGRGTGEGQRDREKRG